MSNNNKNKGPLKEILRCPACGSTRTMAEALADEGLIPKPKDKAPSVLAVTPLSDPTVILPSMPALMQGVVVCECGVLYCWQAHLGALMTPMPLAGGN